MNMKAVVARKLNIIEIIMSINNDAALKVIEDEALKVKDQVSKTPNIFDAIRPIRSNVSLEQIKKEQNYKPISYQEFRKMADELALEESIEELLALLTK